QILDVLGELGLGEGKTHSSSIEDYEAEKVRAQFERGTRPAGYGGAASSRGSQSITPKIDLYHVSKPGDVMKAILAKKQEAEAEGRKGQTPVRTTVQPPPNAPTKPTPPVATVAAPPAAPARPEPKKFVPQARPAPAIIPPAPPAIASRPPSGPVIAKAPAHAASTRSTVTVVPPSGVVVAVKPP